MNNNEEIEETNSYECMYCHLTFDSGDERDNHVLSTHYAQVEEKLSKIRTIAQNHEQTIENWKDKKRKEFLLKISQERPQLLHILQTSPNSESILDKEVEMELLRTALKTNSLSSFDAMWLKSDKLQKALEDSKEETIQPIPDLTRKEESLSDNQSDESKNKQKMVLILYSLMRHRKK